MYEKRSNYPMPRHTLASKNRESDEITSFNFDLQLFDPIGRDHGATATCDLEPKGLQREGFVL